MAVWAQEGLEELFHVQGQEGQPVRRYPSLKVRSSGCVLLEQMVGVARGHQRADTQTIITEN